MSGRELIFFLLLVAAASAGPVRIQQDGVTYSTYVAEAAEIDLFWADERGVPFRQFRTLQAALGASSKRIRFMMNAGIFEPDGKPSGLLVVSGRVFQPLNVSDGKGNFYLKPNGVFYVDSTGAHIVPTERYRTAHLAPRIAIQSGPLLRHRDQIHPSFRRESTNRLHRNGVGIRKDGKVLFAMTEFGQARYPNLFEFSQFFAAQGCDDALFLDGDISQMVTDPIQPIPPGNYFGAIFAVTSESER